MDFQQVLPDDFLVKVDRARMANTLEVRTPFLDHRLVEHAYGAIPSDWKCTETERRRLQNLMAKQNLPKGFELNRKQGFSVPMEGWMRSKKVPQLLTALPSVRFNTAEVQRLTQGQSRGRTNGARLFGLVMLNIALSGIRPQ